MTFLFFVLFFFIFLFKFFFLVSVACCRLNIHRLVYTSTYNVVFGGQVIENGDESLPYLPLEKVEVTKSVKPKKK